MDDERAGRIVSRATRVTTAAVAAAVVVRRAHQQAGRWPTRSERQGSGSKLRTFDSRGAVGVDGLRRVQA